MPPPRDRCLLDANAPWTIVPGSNAIAATPGFQTIHQVGELHAGRNWNAVA